MLLKLISKILVAVVGFALISFPVITSAQDSTDTTSPTPTAPASKDTPAIDKFSGAIVDISSRSITVRTKKESLEMAITPQTTFGSKKAPATSADFAVGDKVQGIYSKDSHGDMTADSITKKAPKNDSTEPPAAPTASTTPAAQ